MTKDEKIMLLEQKLRDIKSMLKALLKELEKDD